MSTSWTDERRHEFGADTPASSLPKHRAQVKVEASDGLDLRAPHLTDTCTGCGGSTYPGYACGGC